MIDWSKISDANKYVIDGNLKKRTLVLYIKDVAG